MKKQNESKSESEGRYMNMKDIIGLMQKSPPIFKKMLLNDVALLWMRGFHAYGIVSVS